MSGWSNRRIVVAGASGLIGRAVTRMLAARGDAVVALTRSSANLPPAGAVKTAIIDLAGDPVESFAVLGSFDAVIQLAQAPGWHGFPRRAGLIASVGVAGSARLAEAAVTAGARTFVLASSGGIYGPSAHPIRETDPLRPAAELGFYLATKVAAEQLLAYFASHLTVHVLRPFFVYGPEQKSSFLIPRLIESVRGAMPVKVDGGRGPRLNPVHVEDAAAAFVAALDSPKAIIANVAGPDVLSVREIVNVIAARIGAAPIFEETGRIPDDFVADITRMKTELVAPARRLTDGLADIINAHAKI